MSEVLASRLIQEAKRRIFEESYPRIFSCLNELTEEQVWKSVNENTVSIGNLVLHLCGNMRQWILCGLGNQNDERERSLEFEERSKVSKEELKTLMLNLKKEVLKELENLNEPELLAQKSVQGFNEDGVSILVHVIEHFSYHTGQISYIVKAVKNIDLGYYKGIELE